MRVLLLFLLLVRCSSLFAQNLQWAKVLNNPLPVIDPYDEQGKSIVSDASGNAYVCGFFEGIVDFDPGPGVQNLTSAGGSDGFFAKYDASGNLVFAKALGSSSENDVAYSMAIDNLGDIYITGSFGGTVDFDPGPGIQDLTSAGLNDIFIAKYDGSGNYIYARSFGGTDYDHAYSIAVDNSHNVYITGFFANTVDFDPGSGTQNLTSVGGSDVFFARYDAGGNYIYAKSLGGISNDAGYSIVVDASTDIYITGHFSLTADFDPGAGSQNLTSSGITDIFLAKYDASGNYVFAKSMGGTSNNWGISLALDPSDNVYLTGSFDGVVDFDPEVDVQNLTSAVGHDMYLAEYDASGNYIFAKSLPGTGFNDLSERMLLDAAGNIYLSGEFDGTVDFDPGPGTQNRSTAGGYDLFFAKYDAQGNYISAKSLGGPGSDLCLSMDVDASGKIYLTGNIENTVAFDAGTQLTATNSVDIFIAKYGPLSPLPITLTSFSGKNEGPINRLTWTTAQEINNAGFELQRCYDGINFSTFSFIESKALNGNSSTPLTYTKDDVNPFNGKNYYRLKQLDIDGKFTYSSVVLINTHQSDDLIIEKVFPNPVIQKLSIKILSPGKKIMSVIVINSGGKMVMNSAVNLMAGINEVELPATSLIKGEYFLKLCWDDKCENRFKFVKQ